MLFENISSPQRTMVCAILWYKTPYNTIKYSLSKTIAFVAQHIFIFKYRVFDYKFNMIFMFLKIFFDLDG